MGRGCDSDSQLYCVTRQSSYLDGGWHGGFATLDALELEWRVLNCSENSLPGNDLAELVKCGDFPREEGEALFRPGLFIQKQLGCNDGDQVYERGGEKSRIRK